MATSAPLLQGAGGIARRSGDPDIVADARTDAPQRPARFDETVRGNAHRKRSARGVAADQRTAVLRGERPETVEESVAPVHAGAWQRQCQGAPSRPSTTPRQA